MISAMTVGCRILERGYWSRRQKMMMMPACCRVGVSLLAGCREEKAYLDDEDDDGVLGIIVNGVGSLEDSTLVGRADAVGRN